MMPCIIVQVTLSTFNCAVLNASPNGRVFLNHDQLEAPTTTCSRDFESF
jgi:hypothetical protein